MGLFKRLGGIFKTTKVFDQIMEGKISIYDVEMPSWIDNETERMAFMLTLKHALMLQNPLVALAMDNFSRKTWVAIFHTAKVLEESGHEEDCLDLISDHIISYCKTSGLVSLTN